MCSQMKNTKSKINRKNTNILGVTGARKSEFESLRRLGAACVEQASYNHHGSV